MDLIKNLAAPKYPQFRFEFHPISRKVFFIRLQKASLLDLATGKPPQEFGHIVAEGIGDERMAQMCILIWLRGFAEGNTPTINKLTREAPKL